MDPNSQRHPLTRYIDHAVLSPAAGRDELISACELAARRNVRCLCVRPCDVADAAEQLKNFPEVAVGTVIGFPHGTTTTEAKVAEVRRAVADGADELDMVLNVARLRDGRLDDVRRDMATVVAAAEERLVKVILECGYLDRPQMAAACRAAQEAGCHFVKTSTGFGPCGARVEDVRFLRSCVGDALGVKAAGGIRTADNARAMIDAGATRIGTSSTEAILTQSEA